MTVKYTDTVATVGSFGSFFKLLMKWRGSVYKMIWQDMLVYLVLYTLLSLVYRLALPPLAKEYFEMLVIHCARFRDLIPVSFVLGFYVSLVVKRWWDTYQSIPVSTLLPCLQAYIPGLVVTIAVYSFFVFSLLGEQYLDPASQHPDHKIDAYVPVFALLQLFFYIGWLKVAEALLNPFGTDDHDIEFLDLLKKHLQMTQLLCDPVYMEEPCTTNLPQEQTVAGGDDEKEQQQEQQMCQSNNNIELVVVKSSTTPAINFPSTVLCGGTIVNSLSQPLLTFENVVIHCTRFRTLIPLSFVLGFFVSLVSGQEREVRRSVLRYVNLAMALTFAMVSPVVRAKLPNLESFVTAGYLTDDELQILKALENTTSLHKTWVPVLWACKTVDQAKREGHVSEGGQRAITREILAIRGKCGGLMGWNEYNIPLVYTQVVTIAVYSFFFLLLGDKFLDPAQTLPGHSIDFYVPVLALLQLFFYMSGLLSEPSPTQLPIKLRELAISDHPTKVDYVEDDVQSSTGSMEHCL
ncbi:Bestrophin-2-like 1 [Homarus americanus]|uniref:Bestrophin homolog n=1 Tax=Homarus americanus TaxID=6706 RepID=A0A8J5N2R3_HOMAM|nr:Bestrophin-2-like 1 [Homarus americanus]